MIFQLPVAACNVKPHQVKGLHLLSAFAIFGSGAIFALLYSNVKWLGMIMMITGLVILFTAIFKSKWLALKTNSLLYRGAELALLLCAAVFTAMRHLPLPATMLGILCAGVALAITLEQAASYRQVITVDDNGIKLPAGARRRHLSWQEAEQVLLRYSILTIDCVNNNLYQYTVVEDGTDKLQFERFCAEKVAKAIDKREQDW